jgi:hypothetical protein
MRDTDMKAAALSKSETYPYGETRKPVAGRTLIQLSPVDITLTAPVRLVGRIGALCLCLSDALRGPRTGGEG